MDPWLKTALQALSYVYLITIVLGRIYCGMHGFLDVTIGASLGALLSIIHCAYGYILDDFLTKGSFQAPIIVVLLILLLVRIHPEPADDCPCFDDSVAFAGTIMGVNAGFWHYAHSGLAWDNPMPATVPYSLDDIGWLRTLLRIFVGVFVVFSWRKVMKSTLFRILPPVFRVVEDLGLILPRRFFKSAS